MDIQLSSEQVRKLQQIAGSTGKSVDQIVQEAVQFLIDFAGKVQPANQPASQKFLPEKDLEARLASILR